MRGRKWFPRMGREAGALLVLLLLAGAVGCVFERRPDPEESRQVEAAREAEAFSEDARADPVEAAASLVEMFREAVQVGDLSLALNMLHRDAVLLDELVGDAPEGASGPVTRGELLLAVRRMHQEGLRLHPARADVVLLEDAAVVTTYLDILRPVEEGHELAVQEGRAWETVVLAATPEGWRIRHMHRSLRSLD